MTKPIMSPDGAWEWDPDSQSWRPRGNPVSGTPRTTSQATPSYAGQPYGNAESIAPQVGQVMPAPADQPRAAGSGNGAGVGMPEAGL
jgi:hypothetical protein